MTLTHHQTVTFNIFMQYKPGTLFRAFHTANTDPAVDRAYSTLSRDDHQPLCHLPARFFPGCAGKYCFKKSLKRRSPIKQIPVESFSSLLPDLILLQFYGLAVFNFADREQGLINFTTMDRMQEISLVFIIVITTQ